MKKFIRNLLSGYFLVILILLIELGFVIFVQFYSDNIVEFLLKRMSLDEDMASLLTVGGYLLFRVVVFIVALIIFFKIIAKQEDPEFKIPWIVGMLLLPLFVSFMFIIFGNHGLRKRDKRLIEANRKAYDDYCLISTKRQERYKQELGRAAGTFNYINSTTGLFATKHNNVKYYKNGETFFPDFIEALEQAKEFIFIEFFIISDGKEWSALQEVLTRKAQEGVDVKIIYDDMGCSGTISSLTPRILKKYGIECLKFHPFRPILSGVYNNRDHRKIVIVDHQMAFTGGINLADEYANEIERFGYWKDTMVRVKGPAIDNLITVFLQNYSLASHKVADYQKYLDYEYPWCEEEGFVLPFGDGPGGIDDALIGEQTYINILNYAQEEVFISTPYLIPTYGLLDALRNAALRGVKVHLIVPGIPDKKLVYKVAKSNFRYLLDAGVNIYTYTPGFNHMKTILADGELAMMGTINFDFRSLVHHFECAAVIYKNHCLKDIKADFEEMIAVSAQVPQDFKLKRSTRRLCSLIKLISPLL